MSRPSDPPAPWWNAFNPWQQPQSTSGTSSGSDRERPDDVEEKPAPAPYHGDNLMLELVEQDQWRVFTPAADPWQRVRQAWRYTNEHGFAPMETYALQWTSGLTGFVGVLFGGTLRHSEMIERHGRHNTRSIYFDSRQATARLMDFTMTMYMKHGLTMAGKWMFLCAGTMFPVLSLAAYRNRMSLWYIPAASAVSSAFYKLHLGPRAMLVAGGLGSFYISILLCLPLAVACQYYGVTANDVYHECLQDYYAERIRELRETAEIDKIMEEEDLVLRSSARRMLEERRRQI